MDHTIGQIVDALKRRKLLENTLVVFFSDNVWPLLTGELQEPEPCALYIKGVSGKASALRDGDWKLIAHHRGSGDRYELYDLADAPFAKHDLSENHPQRLAAMKQQLAEQQANDNDAVPE